MMWRFKVLVSFKCSLLGFLPPNSLVWYFGLLHVICLYVHSKPIIAQMWKSGKFSYVLFSLQEISLLGAGLKISKQTHFSTLIAKKACWNSWPPCNGCGFNLPLGHANVTYNRISITIW
jgi:hypothetical protein